MKIASINMRTHLCSVAEENKLSDGSGNVGVCVCVCENPQAGAGFGAIAGTDKKPVCLKAALQLLNCYSIMGVFRSLIQTR